MQGGTHRYQYPPYQGRARMSIVRPQPPAQAPLDTEQIAFGGAPPPGCYAVSSVVNRMPYGESQFHRENGLRRVNSRQMSTRGSEFGGSRYGNGSMYGSFAMRAPSALNRQRSALLSRRGSFCGNSMASQNIAYGTLYRTDSFAKGSQYSCGSSSQYGDFGGAKGFPRGSFTNGGSFRRNPSSASIGSAYSFLEIPTHISADNDDAQPPRNAGSHAAMPSAFDSTYQRYNCGIPGFNDNSMDASPCQTATKRPPNSALTRNNSMKLTRMNSSMNGFYAYGNIVKKEDQPVGANSALSQKRLAGRPTAPPNWTGNTSNNSSVPKVDPPLQPPVAQEGISNHATPHHGPEDKKSSDNTPHGTLVRCNSEKRIGFYFKDVKPSEKGEYKEDNKTNTQPVKASSSTSPTSVRGIVLLEGWGANSLRVDGVTISLPKPHSDETQSFDTKEVVPFAPDGNLYIDFLDEMCDTFMMGCNISLVMADAQCPAQEPSKWHTWEVVRRLIKDVFARMSDRSELRLSVSLLDDDKVMDLLVPNSEFFNLVIAYSPLFGNAPQGVVFEVLDSASEFGSLLKVALSRAREQEQGEFGIILVFAILKQVRVASHSRGGGEDVFLSSLFATGVGDGIMHYTRILDKNPAEPRAMYQFALGGPSQTAAVISLADSHDSCAKNYQFLGTLQRLSQIENYSLRLGSVRRFVAYTKESLPKTREHLESLPEGPEKEVMKRSVTRYELMLSDAEAMLDSPDTVAPKTYVR
uniref:Uncharacterized protein n=1 Tax=Trypanosoma congolense (strain IL3000) TaxID=1068625 RepID=G0UMV0_TRYCI|nr:conserved hypothetical protein [Trypanosoma congolense IL3000]